MIGKGSGAVVVPFSVGGIELVPGEMFRVSGHKYVQFVRITKVKDGSLHWEDLTANGVKGSSRSTPSEFCKRFQGATLNYQAIVSDGQWEAFADFLNFISRWQLDRPQMWLMWLWFQDMAIEREMAELAQRKEAGE